MAGPIVRGSTNAEFFTDFLYATFRLVSVEEKLRERGQRILELEVMLSRVKQENIMLEERNKVLVEHLQRPTPSPSPSEHMFSPTLQVSWQGGA